MTPLEVRLLLKQGGFAPTPVQGKVPVLKEWDEKLSPSDEEINFWSKTYRHARNTGVLTRLNPGFDIDILDLELVEDIERLASDRFEEHGFILPRIGIFPKRLILFRTDEPFAKILVRLKPPSGEEQRLEFLSDGQQCVVHGTHPVTKKPYSWPKGHPKTRDELPYIRQAEAQALIDEATQLCLEKGYEIIPARSVKVPNGAGPAAHQEGTDWGYYEANLIDHDALCGYAMALLKGGMHDGAAVNLLRAKLQVLEDPDQRRKRRRLNEIPQLVASAREKIDWDEIEKDLKAARPQPLEGGLEALRAVFLKWLVLPDFTPVLVVLATVAANRLPGDPVWLGLIAPPSTAKTEILNALLGLDCVRASAVLSPAALLSGTPQKQMRGGAKGGLLREIGKFGILVMKDFASILAMRAEARAEIMAAFREIFDGHWRRQLGAEGGRSLEWTGKLGVLFACTEAYDEFRKVVQQLGDRFVVTRLKPDFDLQYRKALEHAGAASKIMRDELREAVTRFFASQVMEVQRLEPPEQEELRRIVQLAVRLRAYVGRDHYNREIDVVHQPEGPGRLMLTLEQLFAGLMVIGVERAEALRIIKAVALDSTPPLRRMVFEELSVVPATSREIAIALHYPTPSIKRALEELALYDLCARLEERQGQADQWARAPGWENV